MRKIVFNPLLISVLLVLSCHSEYRSEHIQYTSYRIKNSATADPEISSVMKPFADSVNKRMNGVICQNETKLEHKRRASTLGYFITDAYLYMANQKSAEKVDAAFMNSGGIRMQELPAGAVTEGKIYELMPFDNLMYILKIKGSLLKQYLDTLAASDGIIQSGLTVQVKNRMVQEVMIDGKPLDENADYRIVHSDYVVNTTPLLKKINYTNTVYLLRNAILDYVVYLNGQGKKITVSDKDRVIYAD